MSNRKKKSTLPTGAVDWDKARKSFRRLLKTHIEEFRRLCDAGTYRRLEREDGI